MNGKVHYLTVLLNEHYSTCKKTLSPRKSLRLNIFNCCKKLHRSQMKGSTQPGCSFLGTPIPLILRKGRKNNGISDLNRQIVTSITVVLCTIKDPHMPEPCCQSIGLVTEGLHVLGLTTA